MRNEYLVDYISIATSNYGDYQTGDFSVNLTDIYGTISECQNLDNEFEDSGQMKAECNLKPAKGIEVSLDNNTSQAGIIKICKIGVFGTGGVTDEDRTGYVSPEEKARQQAELEARQQVELEAQVVATARTDFESWRRNDEIYVDKSALSYYE